MFRLQPIEREHHSVLSPLLEVMRFSVRFPFGLWSRECFSSNGTSRTLSPPRALSTPQALVIEYPFDLPLKTSMRRQKTKDKTESARQKLQEDCQFL